MGATARENSIFGFRSSKPSLTSSAKHDKKKRLKYNVGIREYDQQVIFYAHVSVIEQRKSYQLY